MRISDAEWRVMGVLWERPDSTAREVHAHLLPETGWAYTTVKTMLSRLCEKGAVAESRRGIAGAYRPLVEREEARGTALRGLVDRAFEGTFGSLVHHLVRRERLSAEERAELLRLLEPAADEGTSRA